MRVEGEHGAFQIVCECTLGDAAEYFLMAQVHAVEIADGYDGALAFVAKSFDPAFSRVGNIQAQSWRKTHALLRRFGERQICTSNFRPS